MKWFVLALLSLAAGYLAGGAVFGAEPSFVSGINVQADRKVNGILTEDDFARAGGQARSPFRVASSRRSIVSCNAHSQVAVAAQLGTFVPQQFVVTQFAVPVGVPVARPSYVSYGADPGGGAVGYQAAPSAGACGCANGNAGQCAGGQCQAPVQTPQKPATPPTATPQPPPTAAATPAGALLIQNCAKCHTGEAAKGDFRVDLPLTCEQKGAATRALLADDPAHRMPKGIEIDAATRGRLIQELWK